MCSCFEITTYITFSGRFSKLYNFSMKMCIFCNIYLCLSDKYANEPPLNFRGGGVEYLSTPLILRGFFLIAHKCYYVQLISMGGGGGGGWLPLN